jgi:hypothetical protein
MKRTLPLLAAAGLAAALASGAGASSRSSSTVIIRHQLHGCHAWSVDGTAFRADQATRLLRGGSITVVDNDVMPHVLVQTSGPARARIVRLPGMMGGMATTLRGAGLMAHMGASVRATLPKRGVYTFTTKAGEDYMAGVRTLGPDNVLRLKVLVR